MGATEQLPIQTDEFDRLVVAIVTGWLIATFILALTLTLFLP
jgi:hypothetical protein